jgi:hypothetical protein
MVRWENEAIPDNSWSLRDLQRFIHAFGVVLPSLGMIMPDRQVNEKEAPWFT